MEKMNKEQLIEWFIENYGSHPLLAQFISVAEIRQRLNENVKEVTYELENENAGGYYSEDGIININSKKVVSEKQALVHEILHALTVSQDNYRKVGLKISKNGTSPFEHINGWSYINDNKAGIFHKELGRGINEGITDWLSEELTGIKNEGYSREKRTVSILLELVGKEDVLKKYFDKEFVHQIHDDFTPEQLFEAEIREKYKDNEVYGLNQKIVSEAIVKLIELQDTCTILDKIRADNNGELPKESEKLYQAAQKELTGLSNLLLAVLLSNANDIGTKKKLIEVALANSNTAFMFPQNKSIQIAFREILASEELSIEEKMKIVGEIGKITIQSEEFDTILDFLFYSKETSKISMNNRMYQYLQIAGEWNLEQFCIKEGIVNKADFSKATMINDFLHVMDLARVIYGEGYNYCNKPLTEMKYQRIGNHYEPIVEETDRGYMYPLEERRYDTKTGEALSNSYVLVGKIKGKPTYHGEGVETPQWKKIEEQVEKIQKETDKSLESVEIIGNDVTMRFIKKDENGKGQTSRENYTIGEDGQLEVAQVGEVRRLTDDRSKLDIQLMEETAKAGVTTSQLMQVADVMKANLKAKERGHTMPTEKGDD